MLREAVCTICMETCGALKDSPEDEHGACARLHLVLERVDVDDAEVALVEVLLVGLGPDEPVLRCGGDTFAL